MDKRLFYLTAGGLAALFLLSVITSVLIRVGSMDVTFGTINAAGEFVGKESYSLAEWGVTLVTAFLTTATGLISFALSFDENAYLVERRRELEAELARVSREYDQLAAERSALTLAADALELDRQRRKAAEASLEALRTGLKQHIRKLLALQQEDAAYTDAMAESAGNLLRGERTPDASGRPSQESARSISLNPELEEVV